jgi:hypothetical protein
LPADPHAAQRDLHFLCVNLEASNPVRTISGSTPTAYAAPSVPPANPTPPPASRMDNHDLRSLYEVGRISFTTQIGANWHRIRNLD